MGHFMETEIDVKHESEQPVNPLMIFKIVQKSNNKW